VAPAPPPIADTPVIAVPPSPEPESAPEPAPLADEPIAAAAPLDASPGARRRGAGAARLPPRRRLPVLTTSPG
jgi:hypothetical protein